MAEHVSRDYLLSRLRAEIAFADGGLKWADAMPCGTPEERVRRLASYNHAHGLMEALRHVILIVELPASAEQDRVLLDAEDYPQWPAQKEQAA